MYMSMVEISTLMSDVPVCMGEGDWGYACVNICT